MHRFGTAGLALTLATLAPPAVAETTTFYFTEPGTTYTGFIFPGDPRIGGTVTQTRIYLYLDVLPGADAAFFDTDLTLPIVPAAGGTPIVTYNGFDLGWSGSGLFTLEEVTDRHNGTFIQTLFGAASFPIDAVLLDGSRIEIDYTPVPAPAGAAVVLLGVHWVGRRRR